MPPLGFRVVGPKWGRRRLTILDNAFAAAVAADASSYPEAESYLSAYAFGLEFADHLEAAGSTANYAGPVGAHRLNFDLDRDDLAEAVFDAARLAAYHADRYELNYDDLQVYFSGRRGIHLEIPAGLFGAAPSRTLPAAFKRLAGSLAAQVDVVIDTSVYDAVRLFRAPNSRHPDTNLHKIPLDIDTLFHCRPERMLDLARSPRPGAAPDPEDFRPHPRAVADYQEAASGLLLPTYGGGVRNAGGDGGDGGNASVRGYTETFIRCGAVKNERNTELTRAAKNLTDFNTAADLIHALLREPAERQGARPIDVRAVVDAAVATTEAVRSGDVPPAPATQAFLRRQFDRDERDERLAAAAADLAAYRSGSDVAAAVLAGPALDSGLPLREVHDVLRRILFDSVS